MKSKPDESPVMASDVKKPPHEWAKSVCPGVKAKPGKNPAPFDESFDFRFQVADQLYGWSRQVHHYGADSFQLSESDFKESLERAIKFPGADPLLAAVPQVSKDKFKNFKAKAK